MPANSPASVFDAGKPVRKIARGIDLDAIEIKRGIPMPQASTGCRGSADRLLDRMQPGDMVELTKSQATNFANYARKRGIKVSSRKLSNGVVGVWRLE